LRARHHDRTGDFLPDQVLGAAKSLWGRDFLRRGRMFQGLEEAGEQHGGKPVL